MSADILTRAEVAAMARKPTTEWEARLAATCIAYMDAHERVDALCDDCDAETAKMKEAWPHTKIGPMAVSSSWLRRANALRGEGCDE